MDQNQEVSKRVQTQAEPPTVPEVDIIEDEKGIVVIADLPGVPKEKLTVRTEGPNLLIEGEVSLDTPDGLQARYVESRSPHYRRTFSLNSDLDPAHIEASFNAGVLTLRIPKAEHAQVRKIPVVAT